MCGSVEEESAFIKWLDVKTRKILDLRWREVERIAAALVERKRLSGKEVAELFKTMHDAWPIGMLPDGTLNVVSEDYDEEN